MLIVVLWKTKSGGTPIMVGWGVLPVAVHTAFVNFGRFQLPLFKGAIDKELATALVNTPSRVRRRLPCPIFGLFWWLPLFLCRYVDVTASLAGLCFGV